MKPTFKEETDNGRMGPPEDDPYKYRPGVDPDDKPGDRSFARVR